VLKIRKILPNYLRWSKDHKVILRSWLLFFLLLVNALSAATCACLNYSRDIFAGL
jgi:hypothetical protein